MKRSRTRAALLALAVVLAGCATPGARPGDARNEARSGVPAAAPDALDAVGRTAPGGALVLAPGNPLGATRVHVLDEYASASGRRCRRVALAAIDGPRRVVCQRADGHWTATRSLTRADESAAPDLGAALGPSATESLVDVPLAELAPEAALGAALEAGTLADGETLWTFAERTTGRGDNWPAIARANAVDDPARVVAGRVLVVPPGLASAR